jgi:hypothetical protein
MFITVENFGESIVIYFSQFDILKRDFYNFYKKAN